ncbi:hypothetical protein [Myxococcus sp. RHSTA-1-4]|uniref:hypothetical protein n=1 Tax=Myxococcus sp. RHSTA-1-4 TaxID=2874601 RepID=UPI001CBC29C7|nr:hypothetical protein [Myxococcus sp. RHSTA-1-4]
MLRSALLCSLFIVVGCKTGAEVRPTPQEPVFESTVAYCDETQKAISKDADLRASPYGIDQHVDKNFKDRKVSWLMTDSAYQKFIVQTGAKNFGRCNDSGCFLFAAPAATIQEAVAKSMVDGKHAPAVIGQALGLPAKNFEGTLRMMTLDLAASKTCARLPVDEDPGVWKCQTPEDTDCFKFGGYTSGGIPELMAINAPVEQATVTEVP